MTRIPNSNTLIGAVLDGLQAGVTIAADSKISHADADNRIGGILAEHLELTIDKDWNADSFLTVTKETTYGDVLKSLRKDIHVETALGNYQDRSLKSHVSILDHIFYSFYRQVRVKGDISGPGFKNPDNGNRTIQ